LFYKAPISYMIFMFVMLVMVYRWHCKYYINLCYKVPWGICFVFSDSMVIGVIWCRCIDGEKISRETRSRLANVMVGHMMMLWDISNVFIDIFIRMWEEIFPNVNVINGHVMLLSHICEKGKWIITCVSWLHMLDFLINKCVFKKSSVRV